MEHERPNPDELLKAVKSEDANGKRGRLKIFFGACAGVGKTYAMLSALHEKQDDGVNVLVGIAETHGRQETEELLQDLPKLPLVETDHRGIKLKEFDLEAALKAKPEIIAVDEFAHTNAPSSNHPKRWMDVEDLLAAGIDVYTTLNVQHLESLNDIVANLTGIRVKETVPDGIFDSANDITLVDISSDELLERLKEGKVYVTDLGKKRAAENFFRKENLLALRELALRRTAERVDALNDVYARYMQSQRRVTEKLAVCIGAGDLSPQLLRATKRLAGSIRGSWTAIYVENSRHYRLGEEAQKKLERNLRMAEELGAKTEILRADRAAEAVMEYARRSGITKVIVGKPNTSRWHDVWRGSLANDLIRLSGKDIDVYVITGDEIPPPISYKEAATSTRSWQGYVMAFAATAIATLIGLPLRDHLNNDVAVILYLIGVLLVASRFGWAASSLASVLGVLAFNLFFTQPYHSFNIYESGDIITFFTLLIASVIVGSQTSRLQMQSKFFRRKERNTSALYSMSHELASNRGQKQLIEIIRKHIEQTMDSMVMIWLPQNDDIELVTHTGLKTEVKEESVARWVYNNRQPAGIGTTTMPSARGYYLPFSGSYGLVGVLGIIPRQAERQVTSEEKELLGMLGAIAASALERATIADLAEKRKVEAESEKLRNTLLSSVSHDLRTPLASIKGVISSLLMDDVKLNAATKKELLTSAHDEVARLEHIVGNLLDITLLESGQLKLNQNYYFVEEIVGNCIKNISPRLEKRKLQTELEPNLPAIWVDGLLIEQVIMNLLENAVKYAGDNAKIVISARVYRKNMMQIRVEDNGPGIAEEQQEQIFDKFMTVNKSDNKRGTGLGLAICRGIIKAHNGNIIVRKALLGGADFIINLPLATDPADKMENK